MAHSSALSVTLQASIVKLEAKGHWLTHSALPSFDSLQLIIDYGPAIEKPMMPAIFWPSNATYKVQFFFPDKSANPFTALSTRVAIAA